MQSSNETPEFCVGQQVNFQLSGLPGYVNLIGSWSLPGKFVNEPTNYSATCVTYVKDDDLLRNTNQTSCWFVNGSGGSVSIGASLLFANGQTAAIAANGIISIYRPAIYKWDPLFGGTPQVIIDSGFLSLGSVGDGIVPDMTFAHYIQSKYSGIAGYTQLVSGEYASNLSGGTDGYELDNTEWPDGQNSISVSNFGEQVPFEDGPNVSLATINDTTAMSYSFETYLRFRPDAGNPNNNIFVTLRLVTWSVIGSADKNNGVWTVNPGSSSSGPSDSDSDNFPTWTDTFYNSGESTQ